MNLTKEDFFEYDFVEVTNQEITFIKDNVTLQERFVVRPNAVRITLKFLEEAERENWIEIRDWQRDPPHIVFKIIKVAHGGVIPPPEEVFPVSNPCPMCNTNLLKVDDGYKCLNCGYKSW